MSRPVSRIKKSKKRNYSRVRKHAWRMLLVSKAALILMVIGILPLTAFEAHFVNVTAAIVMIDPPVIQPAGGQYTAPVDITIIDDDPDATHIFYTVTPGTDPSLALDPQCGMYPGGPKPIGPFTIEDDSVVKAIACDGDSVISHGSLITTEIYDLNLKGKIEGRKYHDLDQSGTLTPGDFGIAGWRVNLYLNTTTQPLLATTVTDGTGYYTFNNLDPESYLVEEESRDGWVHVTPRSAVVGLSGGETESRDFFNFDTGFSCIPQSINFPTGLAVQASGNASGNDDVAMASNTVVNGSVRSNDEIEVIGGGANRTIAENATTTNTIDAGIVVNGMTLTGAATEALPDVMIPTWQARAQDGGTVNGSFTFPNNTVGLVMGPTEIMGNVTFGSSNSVTVKGPLYIHGNLTIGSNSTIIQDPAFGNQFTTIIVDGTITIDSNITFSGAGSTGTFLLISTSAPIAGDNASIETSSNNSDLGDVLLYASVGDIHIRSNRTLLAAFATHGTGTDADDNGAVRLDSNVTVNYRTLPTTVSCGPRQPYETTSHVVVNEFMPNPVGSDQGAAGLPLDGEWVELFNPTGAPIDVAGFVLYDSINTHALAISGANTDTGGTIVPSLGHLVVYRDGDTDLELNNSGGDTVRLFSAAIGSGGVLVDSHAYTRNADENKSFARIPDGAANWVDPDATPGQSNLFFFEPLNTVPAPEPFTPPDLPPLDTEPEYIEITPLVAGYDTTLEWIETPIITDPLQTTGEVQEPAEDQGETANDDSATTTEETAGTETPADTTQTETPPEPSDETPPADTTSGDLPPAEESVPSEEPAPSDTPAPTEDRAPADEPATTPEPQPEPTPEPEPAPAPEPEQTPPPAEPTPSDPGTTP